MNHNQQTPLVGHSDDYEPVFIAAMVRIRDRDRKGVVEDGAGFPKTHAVLPQVRDVLSAVPLKSDSGHFHYPFRRALAPQISFPAITTLAAAIASTP
jgi:hypothetical protein